MGKRKSSEALSEGKRERSRWPLLMTRADAAEYLSLSADTFDRICPVQPVDLPFSGVRWDRRDIADWVAGLQRKARKVKRAPPERPPLDIPPQGMTPDERRARALARTGARGR